MKRWGIVKDSSSSLRGRLKVVPQTEGDYVLYSDYREELAKKEEEIKRLNIKISSYGRRESEIT